MNEHKCVLILCLLLLALTVACGQVSVTTECNQSPVIESTITFDPNVRSADTLGFYLSKSELVVTGEVALTPTVIIGAKGESNYITTFRVEEVLYGTCSETQFDINIIRLETNPGDARQYLKQGFRCILFLKRESPGTIPEWQTADDWFGIQPYNSIMVMDLKRLSSQ